MYNQLITGSMCIKIDKHMFTGDTLFAGSMGRTDFYGGDSRKMDKSLKRLKNQKDQKIKKSNSGRVCILAYPAFKV